MANIADVLYYIDGTPEDIAKINKAFVDSEQDRDTWLGSVLMRLGIPEDVVNNRDLRGHFYYFELQSEQTIMIDTGGKWNLSQFSEILSSYFDVYIEWRCEEPGCEIYEIHAPELRHFDPETFVVDDGDNYEIVSSLKDACWYMLRHYGIELRDVEKYNEEHPSEPIRVYEFELV